MEQIPVDKYYGHQDNEYTNFSGHKSNNDPDKSNNEPDKSDINPQTRKSFSCLWASMKTRPMI